MSSKRSRSKKHVAVEAMVEDVTMTVPVEVSVPSDAIEVPSDTIEVPLDVTEVSSEDVVISDTNEKTAKIDPFDTRVRKNGKKFIPVTPELARLACEALVQMGPTQTQFLTRFLFPNLPKAGNEEYEIHRSAILACLQRTRSGKRKFSDVGFKPEMRQPTRSSFSAFWFISSEGSSEEEKQMLVDQASEKKMTTKKSRSKKHAVAEVAPEVVPMLVDEVLPAVVVEVEVLPANAVEVL